MSSGIHFRLCGLIVRVRVVPRRTVVADIDRRFYNLSGSHHQSHANCVSSVYGIYVSGQLSRDVIGCCWQPCASRCGVSNGQSVVSVKSYFYIKVKVYSAVYIPQ